MERNIKKFGKIIGIIRKIVYNERGGLNGEFRR